MVWVVYTLTPRGEKENPEVIRKAVVKVLRNAEVYVPAVETTIGDDRVIHYLMQGYAFVRKDQRPDKEYFRLENGKYIQSVVLRGSHRELGLAEDSEIETMKEQVRAEVNQGIGVGDIVRICSGPYKNLDASVITEIPSLKQVQVYVQLRSKSAIITLPRSALEVVDRAPLSPYFARLGYLRAWAQMASALFKYRGDFGDLQSRLDSLVRSTSWLNRGRLLFSYVRLYSGSIDVQNQALLKGATHLAKINGWLNSGRRLFAFITWSDDLSRLKRLQTQVRSLVWLDAVDERLRQLSSELEEIARNIELDVKNEDDGMVIQNLLIDGHNLAFRCLYAPGMSELRDAQGRPTGVVLGFLKSLGSLKKRYPEAVVWVSWDGSSNRRKAKYPEYKSNRKSHGLEGGFDQMAFLRELLPLLGVRQVWNPEEEADDVLASMVRGELTSQRNLLFSTDRDLLQLVTESTMLLVPAVGSRKEILFDVEAVRNAMGVNPEKIVQLRAFFGDSSDNLPGVPRVPKKVLKALVQAHGSVSGVYASGLAGVSLGQYERLRSAEPQVRINADLMALQAVEVTQVDPDVDVTEATSRLSDLNIKPDSIVEDFFGKSQGSA